MVTSKLPGSISGAMRTRSRFSGDLLPRSSTILLRKSVGLVTLDFSLFSLPVSRSRCLPSPTFLP